MIELRQRPVTVQHPQRRESAPRRPGPRNADAHAPAAAVTVTDLERFEAVERRARIEYRTAKPCRWPTTARPRSGEQRIDATACIAPRILQGTPSLQRSTPRGKHRRRTGLVANQKGAPAPGLFNT
nr:hypothetical protein VDP59_013445 [Xanthomonas campestris pv. campestris]